MDGSFLGQNQTRGETTMCKRTEIFIIHKYPNGDVDRSHHTRMVVLLDILFMLCVYIDICGGGSISRVL